MSHPERYDHHIGGQRVAPSDGAYFPSVNPATGAELYSAARGTRRTWPGRWRPRARPSRTRAGAT